MKHQRNNDAIPQEHRPNVQVVDLGAMEKLPGRDLWAVIDSVTRKPALVNDVPQIDLDLDDADDLTDLLNKLDREASASAKH
jgi:hypothetical protein